MTKRFGFDLLAEQAADSAYENVSMLAERVKIAEEFGESPIERLFFAALFAVTYIEYGSAGNLKIIPSTDDLPPQDMQSTIYLQIQATIDGVGRVDFVVNVCTKSESGTPGAWRRLIVECDGHEFHERTKEQAARDRARDRDAALIGFDVFRFTGSELWRNPWGCASQVIEWANKGQ